MSMSRVLLLSVASASSLAVRGRVPLSQPLRTASVRMMSSAADDPLAFVKSSVASDKVAPPPPSPPSLAPPSPLPAPPRTLSLHRLYPARPRLPPRPAQVVIFSKTTCPFCRKTKDLFDGLELLLDRRRIDQCDAASKSGYFDDEGNWRAGDAPKGDDVERKEP